MKTFTDFIEEIFERAEEEDERDKPDRNVVMQARKAVNMGNKDITFHDGKTHNVSRAHAQKFLNKHTSADRDNKLSIQNHAQQSHKNFMSHVGEDIDVEEGTGSKVCDQCENGKTENGSTCKSCSGTGYDMSSAKPASEALVGDQHKLDHNKDNKISKSDMKMVRKVGAVKEVTARSSGYGIRNKVSDMPGMDYSKRDNYSGRDAVKTAVKKANAQSDAKRAEYRNKMGMREDESSVAKEGSLTPVSKNNYAEQMAAYMKGLILKNNITVDEKAGLWANIHAKRARGEKMREPGSKGAPTKADFKRSQ